MFINSDQLERISSALRAETDFRDLGDLLSSLGFPFDPGRENESRLLIDAVVPLELMSEGSRTLELRVPALVARDLRMKAFFGAETRAVIPAISTSGEQVTALLDWPEQAVDASVHIFCTDVELASVDLKRWPGIQNWRVMVDAFFAESSEALDAVLTERKNADRFELGVSRLLATLGLPTPWYGERSFHGKPDLASWCTVDGQWIVLLGECTVQRPSDKFTVLLTRSRHLSELLHSQVTVLPTVFTSMDVSQTDRIQAARDRIALVGRSELHELLSMAKGDPTTKQVIEYLRELTSYNPEFPRFEFPSL